MRIFITGSTGLLGRALAPFLRNKHEICGVSSKDFDICDVAALRSSLERFRPEVVVHLAARTGVDACETEREEAVRVNASGSRAVAEEAERVGASVLALSTDYVFDGRSRRPYREDDPTGPLNVYGESKLLGENEVRTHASSWAVVRSAWVFGPGGSNFVSKILEALKSRERLPVVNDQIGSPTFTEDLARGLGTLIESGARGFYHVVNGGQATWFDLARRAAEIEGLDPKRIVPAATSDSGRPAVRPAYSVLDTNRAAQAGVRLRGWEEALAEYLGE